MTLVNNISRVQDPLEPLRHTQSEPKSDKRHLFPPPQSLTCLRSFRKVRTVCFGEGPAGLTVRARGQAEGWQKEREEGGYSLSMTYLSRAYEFEHRVPSWW